MQVAIVIKIVEDIAYPTHHRSVVGVYSDIEAAKLWVQDMNAQVPRRRDDIAPRYEIEIKELS